MKLVFIYVLKDPSGEIRYVGKTTNPKERLRCHLRDSKNKSNHREKWIALLLSFGAVPTLEVIDESTPKWPSLEAAYIDFFCSEGYRLTNATPGGECGPSRAGTVQTEASRQKISLAQKGTKTGSDNPMFGKPSPFRGRKHSEETKAKQSKPKSLEHREKLRGPKSEAACENMRVASRRRWARGGPSLETRAKMSASHRK